jgi:hypothetical protein
MANNITRDYNSDIQQLTGEITALQEEIRSIQRDLASSFLTPPPKPPKSEPMPTIGMTPIVSAQPQEPAGTKPVPQPDPPPAPESDESYII